MSFDDDNGITPDELRQMEVAESTWGLPTPENPKREQKEGPKGIPADS
jgi:hypothetical protein